MPSHGGTSSISTGSTPASVDDNFRAALAEARGRRNIKLFNALMSKSAKFGEMCRVLEVFEAIKSLVPPLRPNEYTYGILLNAWAAANLVPAWITRFKPAFIMRAELLDDEIEEIHAKPLAA